MKKVERILNELGLTTAEITIANIADFIQKLDAIDECRLCEFRGLAECGSCDCTEGICKYLSKEDAPFDAHKTVVACTGYMPRWEAGLQITRR